MPNTLKNKVIRELVMEKIKQIREASEAYIVYYNNSEKIVNIELKESDNFARIIITTESETVYHLTPAEFLKKTIRVTQGNKSKKMYGK